MSNKHAINPTDSTDLMFCKMQARFEDDGYSFAVSPKTHSDAELKAAGWDDVDIALWHGVEVRLF